MKIKKYWILDRMTGQYSPGTEELYLKHRRVYFPLLENKKFGNVNTIPRPFVKSDFDLEYVATIKDINGKEINPLGKLALKEVEYVQSPKLGEEDIIRQHRQLYHRDFIVEKSWWNVFRLKLMFNEHWLQTDYKYYIPISLSIIALAATIYISILNLRMATSSSNRFNNIENSIHRMDSTIERIKTLPKDTIVIKLNNDTL